MLALNYKIMSVITQNHHTL